MLQGSVNVPLGVGPSLALCVEPRLKTEIHVI